MFWFKKADRLNLGEPCQWEDIKVGEVFGCTGCFRILYKKSKDRFVILAKDYIFGWEPYDTLERYCITYTDTFYRLPKETQELFLVTE